MKCTRRFGECVCGGRGEDRNNDMPAAADLLLLGTAGVWGLPPPSLLSQWFVAEGGRGERQFMVPEQEGLFVA